MTLIADRGIEIQSQGPGRYLLPEIVEARHASPADLDIDRAHAPAVVETFTVRDPYLEAVPVERVQQIRRAQSAANDEAAQRRQAGQWERRPGTAYQDEMGAAVQKGRREWGDPVSSRRFFGTPGAANELSPGLTIWKEMVPNAEALSYISDPTGFAYITGRHGEVASFDTTSQEWMAVCDDGLGIRSRGAIMARSVKDYISWYRWAHPEVNDAEITMLSVACGTALPTMQGAMHAGAPGATLLLVDSNSKSMAGAGHLAEEIGFEGRLLPAKRDIFDRAQLAALKDELMQGGVDRRPLIVDAMGIFEYTGRELLAPGQDDRGSLLYNPTEFLRHIYELVRPGGRLIFGQMRDDRPNPDFTMGVVRWPYVSMRSPKEVMQVITDAGIDPSWVTLGLTPDGVYAVASIDKPAETTRRNADVVVSRFMQPNSTPDGYMNPNRLPRPERVGGGVLASLRARARRALAAVVLSL